MYDDFYGFSERPFQLTPDARFYFDSRTHKKAMSYLGYGLAQGEGFIVITGEIGTGKSTLVQHLLGTIDAARLNAISLVSTQVEGDDMLRLAAQGMGMDTARLSKAQLLEQVEAWLEEQAGTRKRTLLVVDEAQNLTISALEELRMLSNFQIGGQALIQILLLGQPEFRDKLIHEEGLEQLRQRVIATHHLEPMEEGELEPYIRHRLAVAGWQGRPEYCDEAFEIIYRHTDGVPRRVNQLASRLMLFAAVEQLDAISGESVERVIADLAADGLPQRAERPAATHGSPVRHKARGEGVLDLANERRIAALEIRLEEQDIALRRLLTLMVDWFENGKPELRSRQNAA